MTPNQIKLVQTSFAQVAPIAAIVGGVAWGARVRSWLLMASLVLSIVLNPGRFWANAATLNTTHAAEIRQAFLIAVLI